MEHLTETFKRFIVFEYGWYYPSGGIFDVYKSFEKEDEAMDYYNNRKIDDTDFSCSIHVFDCKKRKLLCHKNSKS